MAIPKSRNLRIVRKLNPSIANWATNLFVFSSMYQLPNVTELVQEANSRHHLKALFVWQDLKDSNLLPQMIARANLKTLRNMVVHSEIGTPRRVMHAWLIGAQRELIANAILIDHNKIFVISCDSETFELPFSSIPTLDRIPTVERGLFNISEEGSYLHWPKSDVHINLETIRCALDPVLKRKFELDQVIRNRKFGTAIATLRKRYGLKQSNIPNLSDRQVRRIESGEHPSIKALKKLANSHKRDLNDYLNDISKIMAES